MLATRYGFWDEWLNPQKCTFDGANRIIHINYGITELDVQIDIYSDWKEWARLLPNSHWLPAVRAVGGEPLPNGKLGTTIFLINGWRIKPWKGFYRLIVKGNIYTEEGENPFLPVDGVSIFSEVSNLTSVQTLVTEVMPSTLENLLNNFNSQLMKNTNEVSLVRKFHTNKVVISEDKNLITIYDDDGKTILYQFNLSDNKLIRTPI